MGWLLAALLVATYVAMLQRYSVNFPREDDFVQILAVPHYFAFEQTLRGKLTYLFSLSGGHRIATLRLAALVQGYFLGGLNFQALMYFGSALLVDGSLGLRNASQLQARARDAAQAPWIRAEYTDAEGRRWKELDLPALVQQPEFLDVGI